MSDEEMIPMRKILLAGANSVIAYFASLGIEHEFVEDNQPILEALEEGIRKGIEQEERGLYALNVQQEKMLATFEQAKAEASPGTRLQLVAVPEGAKVLLGMPQAENKAGLIGADGKPLTDKEPGIILAK